MKMTANRRAVLSLLEAGPASTATICRLLDREQSVAYDCLQLLAKHGRVKNTGPSYRAKWELVK